MIPLAEIYDNMMKYYLEKDEHNFNLSAEELIKCFKEIKDLPFDVSSKAHYYMIQMFTGLRKWKSSDRPDCQWRGRIHTYARLLAEENLPNPWK